MLRMQTARVCAVTRVSSLLCPRRCSSGRNVVVRVIRSDRQGGSIRIEGFDEGKKEDDAKKALQDIFAGKKDILEIHDKAPPPPGGNGGGGGEKADEMWGWLDIIRISHIGVVLTDVRYLAISSITAATAPVEKLMSHLKPWFGGFNWGEWFDGFKRWCSGVASFLATVAVMGGVVLVFAYGQVIIEVIRSFFRLDGPRSIKASPITRSEQDKLDIAAGKLSEGEADLIAKYGASSDDVYSEAPAK